MIKDGTVVSLSYKLTNSEGEELDRADKDQPFSYLHGAGQIVPGLEKALNGLATGAKKQVTVSPAEGYGEVDPRLRTLAKKSQFPPDANLQVGMRFAAEVAQGQQVVFTVVDIKGDQIALDGNHPLAGEILNFDVEVVGVRDATDEEKSHGHAHGPDGHGHDHDHG
jgi:FKBP-type peptidyl-prolyl cis-trans isomerase SlyD